MPGNRHERTQDAQQPNSTVLDCMLCQNLAACSSSALLTVAELRVQTEQVKYRLVLTSKVNRKASHYTSVQNPRSSHMVQVNVKIQLGLANPFG